MINNSVLHKSATRGYAHHGWLETYHTFSFANYYNSQRMNFGVLRVLNDDIIAKGMGFATHPHENMEIITIPLMGNLAHKDSVGNATVIKHGDVQIMSAGTGILHSEFNHSETEDVKLLQIWVLPDTKGLTPRYEQVTLNVDDRKNKFQQIVSPYADGEGLLIHQKAWFHLAKFDKDFEINYDLKDKQNGVYAFVINGDITINKQPLNQRDGYGVWAVDSIAIKANTPATELLLMEVPMLR